MGNLVEIKLPMPELTDCLKSWFAKIPAPERLAMLEDFAMWGSQVPEKFRMAILHTLTASIGKTVFEYEETKKIRRIG